MGNNSSENNKKNLKIETMDYASALDKIKQGLIVMNPSSGTAANILDSRDQLDNTSWIDFSEIRFFLEPPLIPASEGAPGVSLSDDDESLLNEIDANGGDVQNFLARFYYPLKRALFRGVKANIEYHTDYLWGLPSFSTPDGIIYINMGAYRYEWDLNTIVEVLLRVLPSLNKLSILSELYFSIISQDPTNSQSISDGFFKEIEIHWNYGGDKRVLFQLYTELAGNGLMDPGALWAIEPHWTVLVEKMVEVFGTPLAEEAYTFKPPAPIKYPFDPFPFLDNCYNLGIRLVYRQEWRPLGTQSGEIVRTIPLGPKQSEKVSTKIVRRTKVARTSENLKSLETTTETSESTKESSDIVNEAASKMNWNVNQEVEGGYNCGVWHVGGKTSGGIGGESSESSKETSSKLSETMRKTANKTRTESKVIVSTEFEETYEATSASEIQNPNDEIAVTYIYSKLQMQYEILTRLAEVQDVVMVAEELLPAEKIDFEWVKRHDWIISKVLLDDSFRDALNSISQEVAQDSSGLRRIVDNLFDARGKTIEKLGAFAGGSNLSAENIDFVQESQKSYATGAKEHIESLRQNYLLDAKRYRLYEHIRENILHYCRAIWQHEDPQQRILRYRKRGIMIPLDWRFLPDVGDSMSIDVFINTSGPNFESNLPGKFIANIDGPSLPITDLINPAGPIAFYGNYAVYYMRPEYAKDHSIMPLLEIFKSPYMHNGELMDPAQKVEEENCASGVTPVDNAIIDSYYQDMIDYVSELRLEYLKALKALPEDNNETDALRLLNYQIFKIFYPEYLFRKKQTRRFLLDTNCLRIDLLPGNGSALEPFKQMHRAIDVLKAEQDHIKMELENQRRKLLIEKEQLGDPDIEKVVVITDKDTKIVAGLDKND